MNILPRHTTSLGLFFAVILACAPAAAQNEIPEFNKLRTPTSPAFSILGTTPAEVQRPNTPSTFAVSLLQGLAPRGGGGKADGFAVEAAPYWLVSHPGLTLRGYYDATALQNLVRTFTVSAATVDVDDKDVASGTSKDLGMGVRTQIFRGAPPSDSCVEATRETTEALTNASVFIATNLARILKDRAGSGLPNTAAEVERLNDSLFVEAIRNASEEDRRVIESKTEGCTAVLSARRGFVMDVAAASAWRFAGGELDAGSWRTGSVWATPSWIRNRYSVVGLARYTWADDEQGDEMDLGVRGVYTRSRYGASLEGVLRRPKERDNRYRLAMIFDFLLSENLWFTTSFGRDFVEGDQDSLLAIANFQWNVGDRSVRPDRR